MRPRKKYDAEGKFVKMIDDSTVFDSWLKQACKVDNFVEEVEKKYNQYFKRR